MSMTKLRTASRMVSASTSAARASFMVPFTASAICLFVPEAIYRGKLAATVAACSAALQLVSRFPFASATASWAELFESCRRKATKSSERMGYASQVSERR